MSEKSTLELKESFLSGEKLTEEKLHDLIDSLIHKNENNDVIKNAVGLGSGENALSSNSGLSMRAMSSMSNGPGNLSLNYSQRFNSLFFTTTLTTLIGDDPDVIFVNVSSTHFRLMQWNGVWANPVAASGDSAILQSSWGLSLSSPYTSLIPKYCAIGPSNNSILSGVFNKISLAGCGITNIEEFNAESISYLELGSNRLSFLPPLKFNNTNSLYINMSNNPLVYTPEFSYPSYISGDFLLGFNGVSLSSKEVDKIFINDTLPLQVDGDAVIMCPNNTPPTSASLSRRNQLVSAGYSIIL